MNFKNRQNKSFPWHFPYFPSEKTKVQHNSCKTLRLYLIVGGDCFWIIDGGSLVDNRPSLTSSKTDEMYSGERIFFTNLFLRTWRDYGVKKLQTFTVTMKAIWYFFRLFIGKSTNRKKYRYGTFSLGKSTILNLVLFLTGTFTNTPCGGRWGSRDCFDCCVKQIKMWWGWWLWRWCCCWRWLWCCCGSGWNWWCWWCYWWWW